MRERERVGYPWEAAREEAFVIEMSSRSRKEPLQSTREKEREPQKACRASESK